MSSAFLELVIASLMPYFVAPYRDAADARNEIIDALAEYATRTRAELLHAAHIIAFGMTTLETLAEAKTAGVSSAMRLRHRSCANSLSRTMHQSQKALARSLACKASTTEPAQINDVRVTTTPMSSPAAASRMSGREAQQGAPSHIQEDRAQQIWINAMLAALRQLPPQTHALR